MFPGKRRGVGQQRVIQALVGAQMRHGVGNVRRIPVDDSSDHQVQPRSAELLRLGTALGDPTLVEGANFLGQGMPLFALVQPGVTEPPQFRTSSQSSIMWNTAGKQEKTSSPSPLPTIATRPERRSHVA